METILSIEEFEDHGRIYDDDAHDFTGMSGFVIRTTEQEIKLGIQNEQDCCESFGYFFCNDNVQEFVGAQLRTVKLTDTALNTKMMWEHLDPWYVTDDINKYLDDGEIMFVTLETDRGDLQFVAYNSHNGYYGHEARVTSKQLNHDQVL